MIRKYILYYKIRTEFCIIMERNFTLLRTEQYSVVLWWLKENDSVTEDRMMKGSHGDFQWIHM